MWSNFFTNGGWGMYPVSIWGFVLVAAGVLYVVRPERRIAPIVVTAGVLTFCAGLLGSAVGIVNTLNYARQLAPAERLESIGVGCAESLHNLVLALMLIVVAGILALAGTVRASRAGVAAAG
jgi:hypothetical protein